MKRKKIIGIGSISFAIFLIYIIEFGSQEYDVEPIFFPSKNEKIYLTHQIGLGLNTDIVRITNTQFRYSPFKKEYKFHGLEETLFYRISNDTLYLLRGSDIEDIGEINKKITIIQKQYTNQYYQNHLRWNFEELGWHKFPQNFR